jgi:hypothetical protein
VGAFFFGEAPSDVRQIWKGLRGEEGVEQVAEISLDRIQFGL